MVDTKSSFSFVLTRSEGNLMSDFVAFAKIWPFDEDYADKEEISEAMRRALKSFGDEEIDIHDVDFCVGAVDRDGNTPVYFSVPPEANIEALAFLVRAFLKIIGSSQIVSFSWSNSCSKMASDAFVGGSVVITAEEVYIFDAAEWTHQVKTVLAKGKRVPLHLGLSLFL